MRSRTENHQSLDVRCLRFQGYERLDVQCCSARCLEGFEGVKGTTQKPTICQSLPCQLASWNLEKWPGSGSASFSAPPS